jgi:hypothetical protein
MTDVANWDWTDQTAQRSGHEGHAALSRAIMERTVQGIPNPEVAAEITEWLRKAVSSLSAAVAIEKPASPRPYASLAIAHAHLGFMLLRDPGQSSAANQAFRTALDMGSTAIALYDKTTGWHRGTRYDLHVSLAMAHFHLHRFQEAQSSVNRGDRQFN